MLILTYDTPSGPATHRLRPSGTTIGRLPSCDIVISDPSISRKHASIWRGAAGWRIKDLGSRAGTRVDGVLIDEVELPDSATITLGQRELQVERTQEPRSGAWSPMVSTHGLSDSKLVQSLRSDSRQVSAVGRVVRAAAAMRSATSTPDVARIVLNECRSATGADRALLSLIDHQGVLRETYFHDNVSFTPSSTFIRRVLDERTVLIAPFIGDDVELAAAESLMGSDIGSLLCAPLWTGDGVAGVLYFDRKQGTIHADAIEVILALGYLGAAELERLRVSLSLAKEKERRRNVARLLPTDVAERLAEASGDFQLHEARLALVVGEVVSSTEHTVEDARELLQTLLELIAEDGDGVVVSTELDHLAWLHHGGDVASDLAQAAGTATKLLELAQALRHTRERWSSLRLRLAVHCGTGAIGSLGTPEAPQSRVIGPVWDETLDALRLSRPGRIRVTQHAGTELAGRFDLVPEREAGAMAIWLLPRADVNTP